MKKLYQINENKKKKSLIGISILISLVCLLSILLIYLFHPRNNTWVYYFISLIFLTGLIFFDYYFLFFRLGNIKSKERFLKRISSPTEETVLTFKEKGSVYFSNKLSFIYLCFEDGNNNERKYSILADSESPFKENMAYKVQSYKEYIVAYEEVNNEKE
ncbi:MAG TPA: hypothetical protein DEF61_04830 [Firmicutes bacterium]|nr:hypothetical protein [Bacillota bacterium]HBX25552.1 hypothetical protein [Bacillota bacterium]